MLNRLKSKPSQRYLYQRQQVIAPQTKSGKREWIIARSLCFYRLFDLTTIPAARRGDALKLKIRQWTPLNQFANYIVWQGAFAQVWIWDAQAQLEQQQTLKIKSAYAIPETLLHPKLQNGIQIVQCLEGVEAQYWQNDVLKHSRWWAEMPNLKQWVDFQRICSLNTDTTLPEPINLPLSNKPWAYHRTSINAVVLQQENIWVLFGLAVFIILFAWSSVKIIKWQQALVQVEQKIAQLNIDATPILTAKTRAIESKQAVDKLINLNAYPHQLDLMGKIIDNLPTEKVILITWRYELGQLNFTVQGDTLDPRQYVKAYESIDWFEEVKTENTRTTNQLIISMRVKPTTEIDSVKSTLLSDVQAKKVDEPKAITQKIEGIDPDNFDWSQVPLPDFNKLR